MNITEFDGYTAPIAAPVIVTPSDGATFTVPDLGIHVVATVAGNVAFGFANGTVMILPVAVGLTFLHIAPNQIKSTGTTATATYYLGY
jgi:hypothetical protein